MSLAAQKVKEPGPKKNKKRLYSNGCERKCADHANYANDGKH